MKTKQVLDRKTSYQQAQVNKLEFVITKDYLWLLPMQKQMRRNSPTIIDVDTKLHEKSPSSNYKIEQEIENRTSIFNNYYNRSIGSTNQILSVATNYPVNIFDFFLLLHRYI
jgi:hypothetical protein